MFTDNTLTPKEAVRLCALGMIARQCMRYSELAGAVRHFISRVAGPQIDLMGMSIELLRYEGLVQAVGGEGMEDNAQLTITEAGSRELHALLTARLRPGSDLSKLVIALKMRFLDLLEVKEQQAQADLLLEMVESELARLLDLRGAFAGDGDGCHLIDWLDHDIEQLEARLSWLEEFRLRL
ncbi:protein of unknown function [Magnetospirillum gryphiswaldense MSR-1 v2]|uniref:Uncharacterized protein n=1 Tax=Magnetospirillum gryphiswaldense (strain DSM 6361 / JCM 21280 / NBRC 15271 / MSR-1) TaxID=431944 RepID=V6EX65_MAGGM|nr:hypothetical protein [Magnetospirillum gryphiswaldense]CDK97717.1 protein of unknown function [Magnetospirillum gryphiswaldense MSR-1 v2]